MDTGSNISIVRPDILKDVDRSLLQPVHSYIQTVMGEQAPIHGKAQFQLGIGPLVVPQELWVADIQDQCILGLDFLYPNGCQLATIWVLKLTSVTSCLPLVNTRSL